MTISVCMTNSVTGWLEESDAEMDKKVPRGNIIPTIWTTAWAGTSAERMLGKVLGNKAMGDAL
jgi:hypothetical protein